MSNKVVMGTEWSYYDGSDDATNRIQCPRCESLMVEDKAMAAVFELTGANMGDRLGVSSFDVSLWACPDCGYREGRYCSGVE